MVSFFSVSSRLLGLGLFLSSLLLSACATTPEGPRKKPHDFCYCGSMNSPENKPYCAVWGDRKRLDGPHNVFKAQQQSSCTPQDCSKLFSSECERMQMWGLKPVDFPEPIADVCFCDSALIENDKGQINLVCAAWLPGKSEMLEYYQTKECTMDTCKAPPFVAAKRLCPNGFQPFYQRAKP